MRWWFSRAVKLRQLDTKKNKKAIRFATCGSIIIIRNSAHIMQYIISSQYALHAVHGRPARTHHYSISATHTHTHHYSISATHTHTHHYSISATHTHTHHYSISATHTHTHHYSISATHTHTHH